MTLLAALLPLWKEKAINFCLFGKKIFSIVLGKLKAPPFTTNTRPTAGFLLERQHFWCHSFTKINGYLRFYKNTRYTLHLTLISARLNVYSFAYFLLYTFTLLLGLEVKLLERILSLRNIKIL